MGLESIRPTKGVNCLTVEMETASGRQVASPSLKARKVLTAIKKKSGSTRKPPPKSTQTGEEAEHRVALEIDVSLVPFKQEELERKQDIRKYECPGFNSGTKILIARTYDGLNLYGTIQEQEYEGSDYFPEDLKPQLNGVRVIKDIDTTCLLCIQRARKTAKLRPYSSAPPVSSRDSEIIVITESGLGATYRGADGKPIGNEGVPEPFDPMPEYPDGPRRFFGWCPSSGAHWGAKCLEVSPEMADVSPSHTCPAEHPEDQK